MTPAYAWTEKEAAVIKAAWADDHGRDALTLIVERLAGLHGSSFASDALVMAMLEGRRSVGIDLMRAINSPLSMFATEEPHGSRPVTATERAAHTAATEHSRRGRR